MSHPPIDRLVFGTAGLSSFPTQGRAIRLLEAAYDGGIRHIDTAPLYGQGYAEWMLGRFLAMKGEEVRITCKFGLAGDVQPRLDPRLALPLNFLRKRLISPTVPSAAVKADGPSVLPFRTITRAQVERSLQGSLRRLGRSRIDCYLLHEGLPCFLEADAREWLFRQQEAGMVGRLGVASSGSALLQADPHDFDGFDILQYEAGSIFEVLKARYPKKEHFLHSCFSANEAEGSSLSPGQVLPHWTNRNPDGRIIFFTRRLAILRENIHGIRMNQPSN